MVRFITPRNRWRSVRDARKRDPRSLGPSFYLPWPGVTLARGTTSRHGIRKSSRLRIRRRLHFAVENYESRENAFLQRHREGTAENTKKKKMKSLWMTLIILFIRFLESLLLFLSVIETRNPIILSTNMFRNWPKLPACKFSPNVEIS